MSLSINIASTACHPHPSIHSPKHSSPSIYRHEAPITLLLPPPLLPYTHLTPSSSPDINNAVFYRLYERLDAMRIELGVQLNRPMASGIECTYVVYPEGGYYKRHGN